jgi:hypothetical protein
MFFIGVSMVSFYISCVKSDPAPDARKTNAPAKLRGAAATYTMKEQRLTSGEAQDGGELWKRGW